MHIAPLIQDLAVILGVAAVVTFVFRRIRQPVVLGYVVAGIIVGPHTPNVFSVSDYESIKIWAELGVIFLMFTLGLEFSFRRLTRVGMSAGITASIQIAVMLALGMLTAELLNWSRIDAVFVGCMIAISSTTIIIKALSELNLAKKKFAELVYGILIVEDLAAILMLVALTNVATTSRVGGVELLMAGLKLAVVVGAWFLVGMFIVPRFVKSVSRHGNDEMLTVVAVGLCLLLVDLAAHFHYSVALGSFIMGSILAESTEAKRIEHLVQPLKDIFGAVFFVSVGMMIDPDALLANLPAIIVLSVVIIIGKLVSVTAGAFITGQTVKNSIQTGFSMAQIGEFSFIIASLGLSYQVISDRLYPIIVAASIITTFTTPYLIKISSRVADSIDHALSPRMKSGINNYLAWIQRRNFADERRVRLYRDLTTWGLNCVGVITFFALAANHVTPLLKNYVNQKHFAESLAWLLALIVSAPSLWAMFSTFRDTSNNSKKTKAFPRGGAQLTARLTTVILVGLLGIGFFSAKITLAITLILFSIVFFLLRRQLEAYYRWVETQFRSGFQADLLEGDHAQKLERLAPWDAHLVEIDVPARSFLVGRSLVDLRLREKYSINVVAIVRDEESMVAPQATEIIYPGDRLLCFATDVDIDHFKSDIIKQTKDNPNTFKDIEDYELVRIKIDADSHLKNIAIRSSGLRENFNCMVVGIEHQGQQIPSPQSEMILEEGDVIWVVGDRINIQKLADSRV